MELLANETRLAVLLALWEAYNPFSAANTVPFNQLRRQVGHRDPGNFRYHLEQLRGRFIRKTDQGYELKEAGLIVVKSVITGAGLIDAELPPSELQFKCPVCGASTEVEYVDENVELRCTECDGFLDDELAEGYLLRASFPPSGIANREPAEIYLTSQVATFIDFRSSFNDICAVCSGPTTGEILVCEEHEQDGICTSCGRVDQFLGRSVCTVCKNLNRAWVRGIISHHPAVIAFFV